jgi:hypothetical protein
MSEKCKTQDVAEGKNASARSCIISNKWESPVRREYGERINRLQVSSIKGLSITAKCTNVTEALHVVSFNQTIELCKI